MPVAQSAVSLLWWLPYIALPAAAGCIVAASWYAYRGLWLRWHREVPIADPIVAKLVTGIKPPPDLGYAAAWLVAGIVIAGLTITLAQ